MSSESNREVVETFGADGQPDAEPLERITGMVGNERQERAEKATETQQADVDEHSGVDYYDPPYDPQSLALMAEQSETVARCSTAISQGVAGYGFSFVRADREEGESEPPGRSSVEDFWLDGDWQLGPDAIVSTPEATLEHVYDDRIQTGYGTLELLINDATYTPTGGAHVPSHTIRKRKDAPGYVQLENGRPTTFYGPAGGRDNGVFVDTEGNVGTSAGAVGNLANELLVTSEYSTLAPHYGVPPGVPALQTLSADLAAREYQYRFFENDGVPRFAVVVEGGELTDKAWKQLKKKLKDLKGTEDAHRGILIEATGDATAGPEDSVNVRIEPLTVGEQEEGSFIEYRQENEHNIAQAYNVPPVVRGRTSDVNYNTALEQRRQFAQSEIKPRQQQFAAQLTKVIHETMLEVDGWAIEFELHGGEDELRRAQVLDTRSNGAQGTRTVDELREELGEEPLGGSTGEMLVAELGTTSSGGVGGGSGGSGGDQQEQARQERRTERLIEIGANADDDD